MLDSAIKCLMRKSFAILQDQTLFGSIIADLSKKRESLWADAGIVHSLDFELALVKIQEGTES